MSFLNKKHSDEAVIFDMSFFAEYFVCWTSMHAWLYVVKSSCKTIPCSSTKHISFTCSVTYSFCGVQSLYFQRCSIQLLRTAVTEKNRYWKEHKTRWRNVKNVRALLFQKTFCVLCVCHTFATFDRKSQHLCLACWGHKHINHRVNFFLRFYTYYHIFSSWNFRSWSYVILRERKSNSMQSSILVYVVSSWHKKLIKVYGIPFKRETRHCSRYDVKHH